VLAEQVDFPQAMVQVVPTGITLFSQALHQLVAVLVLLMEMFLLILVALEAVLAGTGKVVVQSQVGGQFLKVLAVVMVPLALCLLLAAAVALVLLAKAHQLNLMLALEVLV
jgi:hypothetical protein